MVVHNFGGNTYDSKKQNTFPVIQMLNDLVGMRVSNIENYKRKISEVDSDMETWPPLSTEQPFKPRVLPTKKSRGKTGEPKQPKFPKSDQKNLSNSVAVDNINTELFLDKNVESQTDNTKNTKANEELFKDDKTLSKKDSWVEGD